MSSGVLRLGCAPGLRKTSYSPRIPRCDWLTTGKSVLLAALLCGCTASQPKLLSEQFSEGEWQRYLTLRALCRIDMGDELLAAAAEAGEPMNKARARELVTPSCECAAQRGVRKSYSGAEWDQEIFRCGEELR